MACVTSTLTRGAAEILAPRERIRQRLVRPMPADQLVGWGGPLAITLVAGLLRFARLQIPHNLAHGGIVFDETYYAHDSLSLLRHGVETGPLLHGPAFVVHPPLGKWMIALGEWLFGHNHTVTVHSSAGAALTVFPATSFSFRFSSALFGTLAVLILARTARRMFRSTLLGCFAGLLLALDGLAFVQSRIALLDIFLMFWIVAATACLVADRDDGRRRLAAWLEANDAYADAGRFGPWLGVRWWRVGCGICVGAACATKWSGIYFVGMFLLLSWFWDTGARRIAGVDRPWTGALLRDGLPSIVPLALVPAVVYTASWTGWFLSDAAHAYDHDKYVRHGQSWLGHARAVWDGWVAYQKEALRFHQGLDQPHPYRSTPWSWLFLGRPVALYYTTPHSGQLGCTAPTCAREILDIGTPAIWWASVPAVFWSVWRWIARRDWRSSVALVGFAAGYLVWFWNLYDGNRTMFLFYALPALPFLIIAITQAAGSALEWSRSHVLRRQLTALALGVYSLVVVANFGYLYPILTASTLSYDQWHARMWFDNCGNKNKHLETAPCWI